MPIPMRRFLYGLTLALSVLCLAPLLLALDTEPTVRGKSASRERYLGATRQLLSVAVRSPQAAQGKLRTVALSEEDLTAVANFALMRKNLEGAARASIHGKRLDFWVSVKAPFRFFDGYWNFKLVADDAQPQAIVKKVKLGRIALPSVLVRLIGWRLLGFTDLGRYGLMTAPLIRELRIGEERLQVSFDWDAEAIGHTQELVADLADRERLKVYYARLSEAAARPGLKRFVALTALTRPLFELAKARSEGEESDPVGENRALILVLGAYANGKNLASAIYPKGEAPVMARRDVLLSRRIDAAQHFTASALLAISGHRALADMVGLAKEFNDTHGGSGFSFVDLAADRAGAVFGKAAVKSPEEARRVQDLMSQGSDESLFMPSVRDLPENLDGPEFERRFGDIDSPDFLAMKAEIETRIAACPLYRGQ